jgi:hypothetical protein
VSGAALLASAHETGMDWDEVLGEPGPGGWEALDARRGAPGVGRQPLPARTVPGRLSREMGL